MPDITADYDRMRAASRRIREIAHPEDAAILALATWLDSHADIHALRTCNERLVKPCPASAVAATYLPSRDGRPRTSSQGHDHGDPAEWIHNTEGA